MLDKNILLLKIIGYFYKKIFLKKIRPKITEDKIFKIRFSKKYFNQITLILKIQIRNGIISIRDKSLALFWNYTLYAS